MRRLRSLDNNGYIMVVQVAFAQNYISTHCCAIYTVYKIVGLADFAALCIYSFQSGCPKNRSPYKIADHQLPLADIVLTWFMLLLSQSTTVYEKMPTKGATTCCGRRSTDLWRLQVRKAMK